MHNIKITIDSWKDMSVIADLHLEYLETSYTKNRYLKNLLVLYYMSCRDNRDNSLITLDMNGAIIGYACLVNSLNKLYFRRYFKNPLYMTKNFAMLLYSQNGYIVTKTIERLFNEFCRFIISNVRNYYRANQFYNYYELRPIVVKEGYQGRGVAKILLAQAEELLRERGEKKYFLRVHEKNLRAINFYNKSGFNLIGHEGELWIMEKILSPKQKVLVTTQVFPPEVHPSAVMVKELANDISADGYQVTVATGYPHHPYGWLYPGYKKGLLKTENCNGFRVVRGWHFIIPSSNLILRAFVMVSQSMAYLLDSLVSPRPDVIISYGPPLVGPLISAIIARLSKAKLLTLIYDIYPDIAIETGYLRNPVIIRAANKLERFIYSRSDKIGVLSEGFRQTLIENKGVEAEKVAIIPVWLDVRDLSPMDRNNLWRRDMHIPADKFVVLYAGTIGLVSGAEIVVETAGMLRSYPDILFLMVGEGYAKDKIEAQVKKMGLPNIKFLPFQPRERLSEVQATADVSLVTLAPGRGKTSVPSKVLGYMAAARPVIASVDDDCDTAELIRTASCGLVTPPADARLLAQAILSLFKSPGLQKEMGERGRKYFEDYLERKQVLTKYIALVRKMADGI